MGFDFRVLDICQLIKLGPNSMGWKHIFSLVMTKIQIFIMRWKACGYPYPLFCSVRWSSGVFSSTKQMSRIFMNSVDFAAQTITSQHFADTHISFWCWFKLPPSVCKNCVSVGLLVGCRADMSSAVVAGSSSSCSAAYASRSFSVKNNLNPSSTLVTPYYLVR